MTQEKLLEIIKKILKTDANLDFLLRLNMEELKTLTACIRDRVEGGGG